MLKFLFPFLPEKAKMKKFLFLFRPPSPGAPHPLPCAGLARKCSKGYPNEGKNSRLNLVKCGEMEGNLKVKINFDKGFSFSLSQPPVARTNKSEENEFFSEKIV